MSEKRLTNREWLEQWVGYQGDDCINWPFGKWNSGYGVISTKDRERIGAHRAMCLLTHGDPPTDTKYVAAHYCGNRACVNPNHIRWATHKENSNDMIEHGTRELVRTGKARKLTEDDVHEIRRRLASGAYIKQLAREFGVTKPAIQAINKGRSWAWLETPGIKKKPAA